MLFWICLVLLTFNFAGYIAVLYALAKWVPIAPIYWRGKAEPRADDPLVYLLVPTWNERPYLREKILNLRELVYDRAKLRVLICDGGSTDGSRESIVDLLGDGVEFVECPSRGKIAQLNFGLDFVPASALVAISDADALFLRPDALLRAVDYFREPKIGVVGAWGIPNPASALPAEQAFWDKQNRMRHLESVACTASIVTAQFYLCPRSLLTEFPEDCVADDVYVALLAHGHNLRVIYAHEIEAIERRQPGSHLELFRHKFRKANAYTRELLRPLHRLPFLSKRRKFIYLFKIYQFFHLPWVGLAFGGSVLARLYYRDWTTLGFGFGVLFFCTLGASLLVEPPVGKSRGGFSPRAAAHTVVVFTLVNAVLMLNSLAFPFWTQDSRYARVRER